MFEIVPPSVEVLAPVLEKFEICEISYDLMRRSGIEVEKAFSLFPFDAARGRYTYIHVYIGIKVSVSGGKCILSLADSFSHNSISYFPYSPLTFPLISIILLLVLHLLFFRFFCCVTDHF